MVSFIVAIVAPDNTDFGKIPPTKHFSSMRRMRGRPARWVRDWEEGRIMAEILERHDKINRPQGKW
jgi:hypothetical protein